MRYIKLFENFSDHINENNIGFNGDINHDVLRLLFNELINLRLVPNTFIYNSRRMGVEELLDILMYNPKLYDHKDLVRYIITLLFTATNKGYLLFDRDTSIYDYIVRFQGDKLLLVGYDGGISSDGFWTLESERVFKIKI